MDKQSKIDYEELKRKTLEQLRSGKSLFGKDGAFAPLLKDILEAALDGEIEGHLDDQERSAGNRKNGKTSKKLKTRMGRSTWRRPGTGPRPLIRRSLRNGRRSWPRAWKAGSSACTATG
jgi:putative transposase